jgi:hypothetical protein
MRKQPDPLPESITQIQAQLQQFRATHALRTKLPATLWQSAAELARSHGVYVVARSLKLDYSTLKRHLNGSPRSVSRLRKKSPPKFVELIGAPRQTVDEYVIEFESARGRKLRIHCKTNTPPDWPVLLRAWR